MLNIGICKQACVKKSSAVLNLLDQPRRTRTFVTRPRLVFLRLWDSTKDQTSRIQPLPIIVRAKLTRAQGTILHHLVSLTKKQSFLIHLHHLLCGDCQWRRSMILLLDANKDACCFSIPNMTIPVVEDKQFFIKN